MFEYGWWELKANVWNNSFSYTEDSKSRLWIPELKETTFQEVKKNGILLGEKIVFAEKNNEGRVEYSWLENFLYFLFEDVPTYVFDNHNHAFAFWRREVLKGNLKKGLALLHIDQHSDMKENAFVLNEETWEAIVDFTNTCCNVGNFIQPGIKSWIISEVEQIRTEYGLLHYEIPSWEYILDIDLDFWESAMSIQDYQWTIGKTKLLMENAKLISIATSPYFLNQNQAIKVLDDLFA